MSKQKKLIPQLRFPEFKDEGEWEETTLGTVATFSKGKGISKSDISTEGNLPCIRYGQLYTDYNETISCIVSKTNLPIDSLVLSNENDVIIPASGETQEDIATASCVLKSGVALGGDINIIRSSINGVFLSYYLNNAKKREIAKLSQGISVVHLYSSQLATLEIEIPNPKEQQRIADCLSSIDDLITAQAQKLEALKKHKKGLLQKLFPAQGETMPALRFPEFEKDGEWEEKRLANVCKKITQGGTPSTSNKEYWNGKINWITPAEMGKTLSPFISKSARQITVKGLNKCSSELLPEHSIIISTRAPIGLLAINAEKTAINQGCKGLIPNKEYDYKYLYYILLQNKWKLNDLGAGSTFKELTADALKQFEIFIPNPKEQQKIAACLSSIDDLITAQAQKLEALKKYKKGLLQGLFPAVNEDAQTWPHKNNKN